MVITSAYGRTASERRESRVELWNRHGNFTLAMLYPQCDCRVLLACAVTPAGRAALTSPDPKLPMPSAQTFIDRMKTLPAVEAGAIEAFVKAGPETKLYIEPSASARSGGLEHGISIILRLSYAKPELLDLRLNGHLLRESTTDGYQTWLADGFTHIQVNVPPAKTRTADLFIVSCAYRPEVQRHYGWRPPQEVMTKLKATNK